MQNTVDDTTGSHETRVYRPANNTAQRVPCSGVKPVPEFLGKCQPIGFKYNFGDTYIKSL